MIIGIVAVDRNNAIGKGGDLPWHYSADMKHFKQTTTGHACIMGSRTWRTLKKPLPNRLNIILTRNRVIISQAFTPQDSVVVVNDLETALAQARSFSEDAFIIGGEQVFRAFLPYIDRWIVTEVPLEVEGADTFMPENYLEGFKRIESNPIGDDLIVTMYDRSSVP